MPIRKGESILEIVRYTLYIPGERGVELMTSLRNAFLSVIIITVVLFVFSSEAAAAQQTAFFVGSKWYTVDGQSLKMDAAPFIQEGRTFVPLRYLAYALGLTPGNILWSDRSRTVTLSKEGITVTMCVGKKVLYINGCRVEMNVAPVVIPPGRVCLPARFVAEAFGYHVRWNVTARAVIVVRRDIAARATPGEGLSLIRPFFKVVLDPGHGGHDPGAVAGSLREADLILDLALKVARELEQLGVNVRLTRQEDRYISFSERAALANQLDADLFVSLHCNAATNSTARGFETYIHSTADASTRKMARKLHEKLVAFLSQYGVPDRRVKEADFYVLRQTRRPATLLECLFITNTEDAKLLQDTNWRDQFASEISRAIVSALAEKYNAPQPLPLQERG
ncbi:N-acetylmuramoyl-L-alanine amidase LytC [Fervidicola ferrireducens]|uniref:N-acetylmuramoyl-L-alanine amidase LytC n=1 Tax=Fervidicola ferrireducens TaxID=520764 RepID=A0A140L4L2_9FIRM|nr:N-acetylmuramoyl-L-alanine amidase [Fervidicola ferrireducens]KXG75487.1 N-acetylmuramoyl-L-alanine amidase LytC [Fervidicola ferrireducens]